MVGENEKRHYRLCCSLPHLSKVKPEHQKPGGLPQALPISIWKWERITIDFITGSQKPNKQHDSIWVVINRLTKVAHFLAIKVTFTSEQLADYISKK